MVDVEPILEPDLLIVDPHHHLWDWRSRVATAPPPTHPFETIYRATPLYLLDQLLADFRSGHNVTASVYIECRSMHRADGPVAFKPVGETEFVNGVGAMSASGLYGDARACAGIVGHVDLALGDGAAAVLEAHLARAPDRFRGIRHSSSWDADSSVLGPLSFRPRGLLGDAAFRRGFAHLARLGLSFDAWVLEPQLPELQSLAAAFPDTTIVLDHVGTPLGIGAYAGRREERFDVWRQNIRALAKAGNVVVKLGGLAMPFGGFDAQGAGSERLAALWRPYIETCIEAFGTDRCMFESNFPVDGYTCSYRVLWNALKRLAAGASEAEKAALFSGVARRVYRLPG
ncbi:MAG: amidohydrolase family protein [Pseudomonadota bacterium]|nr:amidohydrolase family protein [Pseudomonadota bacterium]